jgi:hypothetical protein
MATEDGACVVAACDKQLRVCQVEHAAPWQQEGCLLLPKHDVAQVHQPLERLALLKLGLPAGFKKASG